VLDLQNVMDFNRWNPPAILTDAVLMLTQEPSAEALPVSTVTTLARTAAVAV
jgi:hypothetical protein